MFAAILTTVLLLVLGGERSGTNNVAVAMSQDDVDSTILDTMDWLNIRGASIAFYDQNRLEEPILKGYGYLSADDTNSGKVSPDTVFMIASVSKIFTGLTVLLLIDQGYIDRLDDDICNAIPNDWDRSACRNPSFPNVPVTWRMLITHRSSLRANIPYDETNDVESSYGPNGGYVDGIAAGQAKCPMTDVIGFYRDFMIDKPTETTIGENVIDDWYEFGQSNGGGAWLNYQPGSRAEYSNFALGYVAALVEHVTNQTFPEFCKDNIFEPLQMNHTAWFRRDLPEDAVEAMPNQWIRRNRYEDYGHYCFIDYASGSLHTSAKDLSKFLGAYLDDYASILFRNDTSLGRKALQCLEEKPDGDVPSKCEFGANWILMDNSSKQNAEFWLDPYKGFDWTDGVLHDGSEAGVQTQVVLLPKAGVYVVVLTNTDMNDDWAAQELAYDVLDAQGY